MCFVWGETLVLLLLRQVVGLTEVVEIGGQIVTGPQVLVLRGGAGGGRGGVGRWWRLF